MFSYLGSTNHIYIGIVYIISGFIGGIIGFSLSLIVRMELSLPGFIICSSLQYNSIISFHGIFMIFFMIMPVLIGGFGNILIPLILCLQDMIFPRLNLFSLWLIMNGYLIVLFSLYINGGINCGWTFYVPLSIFNSYSIDFMIFSLHIIGLSSLVSSINLINSIIKSSNLSILYNCILSALFPWSINCTSLLLIISLPVLAICITMIIFDRYFNSAFFDILKGGDVILFQHLFWFFGHPEAYILILPAFGLINEIISKLSNNMIYGRDSMITALIIISIIGCMVWGHHMFMIGFDIDTRIYFMTTTSIIAIPTGIKILNWLGTIWSSTIIIITSSLWLISYLFSFNFGGITGIILSNAIIDTLLHDSYFVVGHFHYILSLGAIYTIISSIINYYNTANVHCHLDELLGRILFSSFIISSNIIFLIMHSQGVLGFPRRIFDYSIIYYKLNWFSSFGFIGIVTSLLITLFYWIE